MTKIQFSHLIQLKKAPESHNLGGREISLRSSLKNYLKFKKKKKKSNQLLNLNATS